MRRLALALITITFVVPTPAQVSEVPSGPNLVHEGIPALPFSLLRTVNAYRSFPRASLLGWDPGNPDGMIISISDGNMFQVARVAKPSARPEFFLSFPSALADIYYHKDGKYFIYRKDLDGNEKYQLYTYEPGTKTSTLLTDGSSRNLYPLWSNSGKWLVYSSTRRNGKDMDVYVVDPLDPKSDRMLTKLTGEDWAVFCWSPDDTKVVLSDYKSANESYLWLCDVASGEKTRLTQGGENEKVYNGPWTSLSKNGKGIYLITDRDSDFRRLAYLDFATRRYRYLTNQVKWNIDEAALSPDGHILAFVSNEDGAARLHMMDPLSNKELAVPNLPLGVASDLMWNRSGSCLGFVFTSAQSPADVYSVSVESRRLDRWTKTTGQIDPARFKGPELIRWKSFDGRMISGFLYAPPAKFEGKRPVIVNIHGGPSLQSRPSFLGEDNYFINELGTVMIYPNIRGSTGYGKTFLKLDNGFSRDHADKDIGALLDWIAQEPGLDAERVMVQGSSYGGYVALSVAARYPSRVSGAVSYVGLTNLVTFLEGESTLAVDEQRREFGSEKDPKMRQYLESIAPSNNADKIKTPVFIILGENDQRASVREARQFVTRVSRGGAPAWYLSAKDEGHGYTKPWNYQYLIAAKVVFVQTYLLRSR